MFHREILWKDNKKKASTNKQANEKEWDLSADQKIVCLEIIWLVQQIKNKNETCQIVRR